MRYLPLTIVASVLAGGLTSAFADDANYNMPDRVEGVLVADVVTKLMEQTVKSETLQAFKVANPAKGWLFGEDRQRSVRKGIFPAHWLGAKSHFQVFDGVVQPGEYYVFQAVYVNGKTARSLSAKDITFSLPSTLPKDAISCISLSGLTDEGKPYTPKWLIASDEVVPLWIGVQIPESAQGVQKIDITIGDAKLSATLQVQGEVLTDGGIHDAWRLARLKWLNSTLAETKDAVTRPFTAIKVDKDARTIDILGRQLTLCKSGLPSAYTSYFSSNNTKILKDGFDAFTAPQRFTIDGNALTPDEFEFTSITAAEVCWEAESKLGDIVCTIKGAIEFDGAITIEAAFETDADITVKDVTLTTSWTLDASRYCMGMNKQGGFTPEKYSWTWDVSKHQDAFWVGGVNAGAMMRLKDDTFERPLINAYYAFKPLRLPNSWGNGGLSLERGKDQTVVKAFSGAIAFKEDTPVYFNYDLYLTPFKPLLPAQHMSERYHHAHQGAGKENYKHLAEQSIKLVNIHHNREVNPFINYPYNSQVLPDIKAEVAKAHEHDIRLKLYYTTRELTQNIPEFFALASMKGEIVLPRKPGVGWPVTNRNGPHPWLTNHLGDDFVPAWRETLRYQKYKGMLDLAVITTPDSRWNNFYLEGLDFLIKETNFDGLYIDDTALNRTSMQRARHILDADGATHRRVDMHSWNHFNGLARFASSVICFMELYPYYDSLWYGEGFDFNKSPDYILVEMSGIPFGLMSEMLQNGGNIWRGMVFGMTRRLPWSGDPRNVWKIVDEFGIAPELEVIGFWDDKCPVKTNRQDIVATVYRKNDKAMIAIASWAKATEEITLDIDWKALGFDPAKVTITAPESGVFQKAATYTPADKIKITVPKNNGFLLIVE